MELKDRDPDLAFLLQALMKIPQMGIFIYTVQQLHVSDKKCPRNLSVLENFLELMTSFPRYSCCAFFSSITAKMGLASVMYKKIIRGKMFQEAKTRGRISHVRSLGREGAKEIRSNRNTSRNVQIQDWGRVKTTTISSVKEGKVQMGTRPRE